MKPQARLLYNTLMLVWWGSDVGVDESWRSLATAVQWRGCLSVLARRGDFESWYEVYISKIHKLCGGAQAHLYEKKRVRVTVGGASYVAHAPRTRDKAFVIYERRCNAMRCDAKPQLSLLLHKKYPLDKLSGGEFQNHTIGSF